MPNTSSILWEDSTPSQDEALVKYLIENIVAGTKNGDHFDHCVDKVLQTIRSQQWQATYPQRTHVFSVFYGISIKSVVEIKLSLHAQALELFYFNIASASKHMKFDPEAGFHIKLKAVFQHVYKWKMPLDTAHAIRILRNDVMHTGTIKGVTGAYRNTNDPAKLERFFKKYDYNKNQQRTDIQNRIALAHAFEILVQDALIRTMGLEQDDLAFNLTPAWLNPIFGYNHDKRPDWLRE